VKLSAYPKYNRSGVAWLGEVPEHWEIRRLKFFAKRVFTGTTPPSADRRYYEDTTINWYTPSDFSDEGTLLSNSTRKLNTIAAEDGTVRLFEQTCVLVVSIGATIGRIGIASPSFSCNQQINIIVPEESITPEFLFYSLLVQKEAIKIISNATTLGIMNQDKTKQLELSVPGVTEQQQIADFLDWKTWQIDGLISKKNQLIEKLKEKRIALITQVVTKGLNPDVPMRDSAIPWLGKVPTHWKVLSIKRLTPVSRGASPRPIEDPRYFDDEGEYAWVRIADVTSNDHYLRETTQRLSEIGKSLSVPLEPGSLFLSIAGSVGKPMITGIKACIHDGFVYFPQLQINFEYLFYIFESGQPYLGLGKLGTQLNLNTDTVGNIKIGLPENDEQQAIVDYLDLELSHLDALISKNKQLIAKLTEYRTALITAATTGKIDVRNVKIGGAE